MVDSKKLYKVGVESRFTPLEIKTIFLWDPRGNMKVLIFGNGGHARVVADILTAMSDMTPVGIVYSGPVAEGEMMVGLPVINEGRIPDTVFDVMVVALGDNPQRKKIYERYAGAGVEFVSAIHPSAVIGSNVKIEVGCMVCAGVVINSGSHIACNTILNTGCTVDHDCMVGPNVHIAPGVSIAGAVSIGEGAFLGIGSCCVQERSIGNWATVGAGAAVVRDVAPQTTVVGVPAREL